MIGFWRWYSRKNIEQVASDVPAVYLLGWSQRGRGTKIQYVGESAVLRQRLNRYDENWWNCFAWERGFASKREREKKESELIRKYDPPKNEGVSAKKERIYDNAFDFDPGI